MGLPGLDGVTCRISRQENERMGFLVNDYFCYCTCGVTAFCVMFIGVADVIPRDGSPECIRAPRRNEMKRLSRTKSQCDDCLLVLCRLMPSRDGSQKRTKVPPLPAQ